MTEPTLEELGIKSRTAMRRRQRRRWLVIGAVALAVIVIVIVVRMFLSADAVTPARNAVASVDGVPITRDDVAAEAQAAGLTADQLGDAAVRRRLIDAIVARRLLLGVAHQSGQDADPLVVAQRQRAGENVVAEMVAARLIGAPPAVGEAAARTFMAAHPAAFADRAILSVEALVVPANAAADARTALERIGQQATLDDAAQLFTTRHIPFERVKRRLDTASIPPELAKRLSALKPDDLLAIPDGDRLTIARLAERTPAPPPADAALAAAREGEARLERQAKLDQAVAALRAKAKVEVK